MPNHYYSKDPRVGQSLRHSVRDGVAYSVMTGAGESYFSAYALFLKASTSQIALLAALPPLLGSLMQLLSAWVGQRTGRRKVIILSGAMLQSLAWFPIIWLPYFFPEHAVPLLIASIALYHGAVNFSTPVWSSLMGDLVPERKRGRYFGRRTRLASISSFISLVCAGLLLNYFDANAQTRLGFTIVFSVAAAARFYSTYQLHLMHAPPCAPNPIRLPQPAQLLQRLRDSQFVRFSLFVALMHGSVAIAGPFFSVHMLRDLKFTYVEFMCNTAMSVLVQFLSLGMWGRLADVFGNRRILAVSGLMIPILPALWLVSGNVWYLLAIQAFAGLGWSGFTLSAGNFLYDLVPSEKRSACAAAHNVLCSTGVFAGALLGGCLAAHIPATVELFGYTIEWFNKFWGVFLISTFARAAVAALFLPMLREVRAHRRTATRKLLVRLVRLTLPGRFADLFGKPAPAPHHGHPRHTAAHPGGLKH